MFSLCMLLVVCGQSQDNKEWASVLRDAQIANQALLKEGKATFEMDWKQKQNEPAVRLKGEAAWRGVDHYYLKWQSIDSSGMLSGIVSAAKPLEQQPYQYLVENPSEFITYNSRDDLIFIRKSGVETTSKRTLQFQPSENWFMYGVPMKGKPWSEMGSFVWSGSNGTSSQISFKQVDNNIVRQVRNDPDGAVLEIDYSIADSGNPIRVQYKSKNKKENMDATYKWRKIKNICVLDTYEIKRGYFNPFLKSYDVLTYKLHVSSVDVEAVPDLEFKREVFTKFMTPNTKINSEK